MCVRSSHGELSRLGTEPRLFHLSCSVWGECAVCGTVAQRNGLVRAEIIHWLTGQGDAWETGIYLAVVV